MTASRRRIVVPSFLTLALATSALASRTAAACSPACEATVITFAGQVLPAGVRALPVPYSRDVAPVLTLGGVVVPSTLKALEDQSQLLVPTMPLAAGAYSLSYEQQCSSSTKGTAAFQVGASVAEPHATGTLHVATQFVPGIKDGHVANGGDCSVSDIAYDHVIAQITFEPAPELASYLSLTRFSADLAASGKPWQRSFSVTPSQSATPITVASFTASCAANPSPNEAPGVLTMSIYGQIAGEDARLPVSTTAIDLTCPVSSGAASSSGRGTSGCSASPSSGPASSLAAFGLCFVALAVVARRRRIMVGGSRASAIRMNARYVNPPPRV